MKKLTLFLVIESCNGGPNSCGNKDNSSSLFVASQISKDELHRTRAGLRTTSSFHKQLKLMLYPQTCVPLKMIRKVDKKWQESSHHSVYLYADSQRSRS